MTDTAAELAPRIDLAVTAVAGVRESYSARPVVARAYERMAEVEGSLAAVEEKAGERAVTVCIGVSVDEDSAVVASAVAEAVRRAGADAANDTVRVRVARLVAPRS
ncbi:hypothetical protein [Microbacterium sp. 1P10AE]|jgi:hypothetical protein|uniref:hypothetical protein n=1 Tax=Microbacterium sp. 1P10AE TaxID=3132286 RepID=UPI0039A285CE